MLKLFNKPHPYVFNAYSALIPSIITFLIIAVFAPFQFREFELSQRLIGGFLVAIVVALSIWATIKILKTLLPKPMSPDNWTIGKEFLLILIVLIIIVLIIFAILITLSDFRPLFGPYILKVAAVTVATSFFPILISVLYKQFRYQKKQLQRAEYLTTILKPENSEDISETIEKVDQTIIIKSEKGDIKLKLLATELAYVKSEGNYVEVYFINSNQLQKQLLRNTLKQIEMQLPSSSFFRCHNRFIININYIIKVDGNARNLTLHLKYIPETIPVSRAKANSISDYLENL